MVCAHRYTRRGLDYRWGQGQCFTLTNKLQFDETWEPCRGRDTYRSDIMSLVYFEFWRHAVFLKVFVINLICGLVSSPS